MSAHTPGPWKSDSNLGCKAIKGGKRGATKQAQYTEIAYTVGLNNEYEDEANARLISAAPDMYEALKIARDYMSDAISYAQRAFEGHEETGGIPLMLEELAQVDAALAKAGQ